MVFNNSIARFSIGYLFFFYGNSFCTDYNWSANLHIVSRPTHRMMLKKIAYHHCQRDEVSNWP